MPHVRVALIIAIACHATLSAPHPDVDAVFADVDTTTTPGCALGVYQRDATLYARGYGMADLAAKVPIGTRSVFEIASASKQFTAAAIHLLAAEKKLSLDDSVRKHVPRLPAMYEPVTLAQMIHHTGGMRDYLYLAAAAGYGDYYTIEQALGLLGFQRRLNFPAGTNYQYSNSGYFLLSQVVQSASGTTLRRYAQERMLVPLGMKATHFHDDNKEPVPHLAIGYRRDGAGYQKHLTDLEMMGDGGINTNVDEIGLWLANFDHNILGGLGESFVRAMETPAKVEGGRELAYASGLRLGKHRGLRTVGHSGAFVGYRSALVRFPAERFSVAVLCNASHLSPWSRAMRVAEIYLKDKLLVDPELKLMKVPVETLRKLTGWYLGGWALGASAWQLSLADDALHLELLGEDIDLEEDGRGSDSAIARGQRYRLGALAPDRFIVEAAPHVQLRFSPGGLVATVEGAEEAKLRRVEPLHAVSLEGLAGEYWSDEIRQAQRFVVRDGKLLLDDSLVLVPFEKDRFVGAEKVVGPVEVTFTRDARGRAIAVELSTPQLRGLRLTRR